MSYPTFQPYPLLQPLLESPVNLKFMYNPTQLKTLSKKYKIEIMGMGKIIGFKAECKKCGKKDYFPWMSPYWKKIVPKKWQKKILFLLPAGRLPKR